MAMEVLSRPLHELCDHYTAVVVGSGYGGSIMASRLARAGQAIALLERGRELHPGDFQRTMSEAERQLQLVDGRVQVGDRRRLTRSVLSDRPEWADRKGQSRLQSMSKRTPWARGSDVE